MRFQVFNLELNMGLQSSYETGLDVVEFDPYWNHLIVRDIKSDDVVGTDRMMCGALARQHLGFYSEREFDVSCLKQFADMDFISHFWRVLAPKFCCRSNQKSNDSPIGIIRRDEKKLAEDCYEPVLGRVMETNLDRDDEVDEVGGQLLST